MDRKIITEYLQGMSAEGWRVFGAHFSHEYDQDGVRFTVYAPEAARVQLIGDFNGWQGYDMFREENGVWSIFARDIPNLSLYKYRIFTRDHKIYDRIDPFAFYSELRPNTASRVFGLDGYVWGDSEWMARRGKNYDSPVNIYEVHPGSWRVKDGGDRFYRWPELAETLLPYVRDLGCTHIELLPITEHPLDASWGYQATGYFSATSRYGTPHDLMYFIDRCHQEGIGVILDFVPVHFSCDFHALHQYDGSFLYESAYENLRYSPWGTALFDFTKPHVLSFLKSSADFWLSCFHFDGLRFDAVSNLIHPGGDPEKGLNDPGIWFLRNTNFTLQARHPSAMLIAEDSSHFLKVTAPVPYGGLGFDYKWDLGWMHDTLEYLALPPRQRAADPEWFTHSLSYFYQDIFLLPLSHDEVVHGKKPLLEKLYGTYPEKFAQLRTLFLYMAAHPGKKLSFMGNELAQPREWNEDRQLDWDLLERPQHRGFFAFQRALNRLYRSEPNLFCGDYNAESFAWIDRGERLPAVFSFRRSCPSGDGRIFAVLNLSDRLVTYRLPISGTGACRELINTDDAQFGGSGITNRILDAPSGPRSAKHLTISLAPYASCLIRQDQF